MKSTLTLAAALLLLPFHDAFAGSKPKKSPTLVIAPDGGKGEVQLFEGLTGKRLKSVSVERKKRFSGGVSVAAGDVDGDGVSDVITGAGPGAQPTVRVFSSAGKLVRAFNAFDPNFTGGVTVASGDVNGDGKSDIVVGAGAGGTPHVAVFDGATGAVLFDFLAYDDGFAGGLRVAAGDVNGDGYADIIVAPGPGHEPVVKVFSGTNLFPLLSYYPFDSSVKTGVFVAASDIDGDGWKDVVSAAGNSVVFHQGTGADLLGSFVPFEAGYAGSVRVAAQDLTKDGKDEIIVGTGVAVTPRVRIFDGTALGLLRELRPNRKGFLNGINVSGR